MPTPSQRSNQSQEVSLQPVSQHSEQQVSRQVRGRPSSEYGVPAAPKAAGVEVAQMRNLDLNCASVRQGRTDPDAGHGVQAERPLDLRPGLLLPAAMIR